MREVTDDDLVLIDLGLRPNEASGLCPLTSAELLNRLAWEHGYWTILDDGPVERCIAAIGRLRDDAPQEDLDGSNDGWVVRRLVPLQEPDGFPPTDDGEAIAVRDGVVHVFGSLYGGKDGPLQLQRQWMARFAEDDVQPLQLDDDRAEELGVDPADRDPLTARLEVVNDHYRLHRAINDALADSGIRLLDPGPDYRSKLVHAARREAVEDDADWAWRLRWDDEAINVEGAVFLPGGELVVGLRFPVSAAGHPLLVVLDGIEHAYDDTAAAPHVVSVHVVANVGHPSAPVGVRDLHHEPSDGGDGQLVLLVGNLDSTGKGSALLEALPEGVDASSTQWRIALVDALPPARDLGAVAQFAFPQLRRVEGLAPTPDGGWAWVVDEDDAVGLRLSPGAG